MLKVLILQDEISAYNVPFYNKLTNKYDITVGFYTKDKSASECFFKKHQFKVTYFGPLYFVHGVSRLCKDFDVVVMQPTLHNPNYCFLPFKRHKNAIVSWSIGFRVSYSHPYLVDRKHNLLDSLFKNILNKCEASVFYMEQSKKFWSETDLDFKKIFVAPNTTDISKISFEPEKKTDFIFVGTLYKGKGLDLLINAFSNAKSEEKSNVKLHIVGGGGERESLENMVDEMGLKNEVLFHGPIYNENELAILFQNALLSFSPTQAGLSVPKSMGYGVPFVTRYDSITGGELYHITNEENGIIYKEDFELKTIMKDAMNNPTKYIDMGLKAREYYNSSASIDVMANGMSKAIEYAYQSRKYK